MSEIMRGSVDVTRYIILDDATTGAPKTGLTITDLDLTYVRARATAIKNDAQALAAANSPHSDNKAIEVDATNCPGLYRIDWPDAAFSAGVDKVILAVSCTGCRTAFEEIDLVAYDPNDPVRLGLTALPNAAAGAAGGLPVSVSGGLNLDAVATEVHLCKAASTNNVEDDQDAGIRRVYDDDGETVLITFTSSSNNEGKVITETSSYD